MINLNINIKKLSNDIFLLDENLNNSFVSGNKVRKLKGILTESDKVKGLLTIGSKYSSHCLATAYYGKLYNVPVKLIVITDKNVNYLNYPHLKLSKQLGAELLYTSNDEAFSFIEEKKKEFNHYTWIPGGGHTLSAAEEYEKLICKIFLENNLLKNKVRNIILPFGTGTTAYGIQRGLLKIKSDICIMGVTVSRNVTACKKALADFDKNLDYNNFKILDDYAGKYESRTGQTEKARERFFKDSGVLVDPIYNAKSIEYFYRLNLKETLIVNTGGMLNNFL